MKSKLWYLLSLLLALSLVAGACGGDDDGEGTETDDSGESTDTDSGDDADSDDSGDEDGAGEDAGEPVAGGSYVIGTTQVARHLNGLVQSGFATALPGTQLFASPLMVDADFNFEPYLAESWEFSDDGLSLTLNLVDGATFHDGEPVTSEDVKFSIETAKANHPFVTMFGPVTGVETPDDQTVVINLSQPHPALLLALTPPLLPVVPQHIFDDGQDMKEHPRNTEDVIGSGPFKLVEFNPSEIIRLEANPDFFLGAPNFDEVVIQTFADAASANLALEAGEIDAAAVSAVSDIERLSNVDGLTVTPDGHHGLGVVNWLEFNLTDEVLSDQNVRQAIAYAIDRDFITNALFKGFFSANPSPIADTSPFYHDGIEPYDHDIDKAKELLAEAGYGEGDISLTIDYIPGPDAIQKNVAEYIVQALAEVGITVELHQSADFPAWVQRIVSGEFDMTMNNVWNWGDPVIGVHRSYLSTNRVGVIWTNNSGYENTEVDDLLNQAGQELDSGARRDLYVQAQDILAEELPIYWLNNTTFWQAYPENLQNPPVGIWGMMSPMHDMALTE